MEEISWAKTVFLLYCLYNFSHSETKISVTRLSNIFFAIFQTIKYLVWWKDILFVQSAYFKRSLV